jgi:hypothetical protein
MKVRETVVTEEQAFGRDLPSSMVPEDYSTGRNVTRFPESTSVLRSRNVRSIGQKDRWWQYCAVKRTVSLVGVCASNCTDRVEK